MPVLIFAAVLTLTCGASGLGEEKFGNEPVANQAEWAKGVLAAANDVSRVYRRWVNGNEDFCYRGDAAKCNRVIGLFAKIKDNKKRLVLLPTEGVTYSFKRIRVRHGWRLHVPSGIYLAMAKLETDHAVIPRHPSLTIHLGGDLKIENLKIPEGVVVIGADELVARYRDGFRSSSSSSRAQACYMLRDFGWCDGVVEDLVKILVREDSTMRLNGLSALAAMGADAKPAVLVIEKLKSGSDDEHTKRGCERALEAINKAEMPKVDGRKATAERIRVWLKKRRRT